MISRSCPSSLETGEGGDEPKPFDDSDTDTDSASASELGNDGTGSVHAISKNFRSDVSSGVLILY